MARTQKNKTKSSHLWGCGWVDCAWLGGGLMIGRPADGGGGNNPMPPAPTAGRGFDFAAPSFLEA